jgi:hypothetical protein
LDWRFRLPFPSLRPAHRSNITRRNSINKTPVASQHQPFHLLPGRIANIRAPPELGAVARLPMTGENAPRLTALPAAYPQQRPHQRPPSPPGQHQQLQSPLTQLSPSTVKASPQQTPGPLDASGGGAEPSAKRGMRSQIACTRCRRSKTKCENTGQGTTCKACANTNRDCTWDHAAVASTTGTLRRDSTADFDVCHPLPCLTKSISHCAYQPSWRSSRHGPCHVLVLTPPGPAQEAAQVARTNINHSTALGRRLGLTRGCSPISPTYAPGLGRAV